MQCPGCGLYHPARYEQCVSCGRQLNGGEGGAAPSSAAEESPQFEQEEHDDEVDAGRRRPAKAKPAGKKSLPLAMIVIGVGILLASAGGTFFFLSRPPESDRLLSEGQKQLANGQFAFAEKTLEQARAIKPDDPKILLSLARAYVGTDQVERAWSCVTQAKETGSGVLSDPQLASDLAKYYIQRNQYSRASDLLRPLAEQNVPHKKTELADLDALWGDDCFNRGETPQALKCWEEIKQLGEGSRFSECDTRLATIYQKLSNEAFGKDDIDGAINALNNLNHLAPSPQTYEKCGDLYAKKGQLDLAIEQIRSAIKAGTGSKELNHKLAALMSKHGKELLAKGNTEDGYAFLQQAQSYDSSLKLPTVGLQDVNISVDAQGGLVRATGRAWNPGPNQVSYLTVKAELFDTINSQLVWSKDQRVVDEFVAPLQKSDSRPFEISGPLTVGQTGLELRVYLDGRLYKSFELGKEGGTSQPSAQAPAQEAPQLRPAPNLPQVAPPIQQNPNTAAPPPGGVSPEERTLRDLE